MYYSKWEWDNSKFLTFTMKNIHNTMNITKRGGNKRC